MNLIFSMRDQGDHLSLQSAVSVEDAAIMLSVSNATIRNWVHSGQLESSGRGKIAKSSIDHFMRNKGSGKLTRRANKSLAGTHDHDTLTERIQRDLTDAENDLACSKIAVEYESSLGDSYRNKEGIYYTPETIVDEFFGWIDCDYSNLTFCDPCCGAGNFLIGALKAGFKPENIYGFDVDPCALSITRRRFELLAGQKTQKVYERDFLSVEGAAQEEQFDVILTNPPWGKKISKSYKETIAKRLSAGKSIDTSSLFFFAAKDMLTEDGFIGLLLPDAFMNIHTFQHARAELLTCKIIHLCDFGRPFQGLMARATGFLAQKTATKPNHLTQCSLPTESYLRKQSSFASNPTQIFNIGANPQEQLVIERLLTTPHLTLKGNAKWGLGIVTGNNKQFCQNKPAESLIPVYKGCQIHRGRIDTPSDFIPRDFSQYQQVAPLEIFHAESKIVYRFISSELIFFNDTKQRFFLNSANMLVIDKAFPVTTEAIVSYFNSRLINWLFRKVFSTHKVLRSDLEKLPIYPDLFKSGAKVDEKDVHSFLGIEEVNGTFRTQT